MIRETRNDTREHGIPTLSTFLFSNTPNRVVSAVAWVSGSKEVSGSLTGMRCTVVTRRSGVILLFCCFVVWGGRYENHHLAGCSHGALTAPQCNPPVCDGALEWSRGKRVLVALPASSGDNPGDVLSCPLPG